VALVRGSSLGKVPGLKYHNELEPDIAWSVVTEREWKSTMSPLAHAVYEILRVRTSRPEPRITYAELAEQLREISEEFADIHHRNRQLYVALGEVGAECRRRGLPSLPALVVRADTKRPGAAYYEGADSRSLYRGEKVAAWRRELEAVKRTTYPPR
jgi:hypothetical protein